MLVETPSSDHLIFKDSFLLVGFHRLVTHISNSLTSSDDLLILRLPDAVDADHDHTYS